MDAEVTAGRQARPGVPANSTGSGGGQPTRMEALLSGIALVLVGVAVAVTVGSGGSLSVAGAGLSVAVLVLITFVRFPRGFFLGFGIYLALQNLLMANAEVISRRSRVCWAGSMT